MTDLVAEIIEQAMALPPEDRIRIAEFLRASVPDGESARMDALWEQEVARRVREVDEGTVQLVAWEEVRNSMISDI